ncbi:MAG TPA: signal peptidase I [Fastidiosipila sp.]|nr:signal peptidase I [Fastidiosipila sp.]
MDGYEHKGYSGEENRQYEDRHVTPPMEEQYQEPSPDKKVPQPLSRRLWEWFKVIVIALALGLLLTTFVIQRNTVIGKSMLPTLKEKDELLIEKVSKWFGGVSRGDIITVHMENRSFNEGQANIIKRVIGLPGDHVKLDGGFVYVNGELLEEPYLAASAKTRVKNSMYQEVTLGADEYYVMGDNRDASLDSRTFGPIHKNDIIGEVLIRIFPFKTIGVP